MARRTRRKPFNLMGWSMGIPLSDDLWLGMQLRNVAMVDQIFIRPVEAEAVSAYHIRERTPTDILMPLSALSQMWLFALYEVLRTWRQRARELIELSDQYFALKKAERGQFLADAVAKVRDREKYIRVAPTFHGDYVARIGDKKLINTIKRYRDKTETMYRRAEALRVTLAKHEVPKTDKYFAEAPGYGRMDLMTGSMYWHYTLKNNTVGVVNRRELANEFLHLRE